MNYSAQNGECEIRCSRPSDQNYNNLEFLYYQHSNLSIFPSRIGIFSLFEA